MTEIAAHRIVPREDLPATVLAIPDDFNPLASGVFMKHQADWVADTADLKLCEKGRRTGVTWAEAQDDTIVAAASRKAGGDNVFYIGDTKDKGLEFIGYCAKFAEFMEEHAPDIWETEEEIEYVDDKGERIVERVAAYRIKFKSGFKIVALASRAAVIRGLQGIVVIDEAAFHAHVHDVIAACNALLIWGGKIRIISTHNGVLNAFNELIKETREGKWDYSIHRITFDDAVANGLYERVCLVRGWTPSAADKEKWYSKVRRSYGTNRAAMLEELDAIPREGAGTLLPLAWIEACQTPDYKVVRWEPPDSGFVDWPEDARRRHMQEWVDAHVKPLIEKLPRARIFFGEDFGLRVDRSSIALGYVDQSLCRHVPFIVELRACPYDQQKQTLFYILVAIVERFAKGIMDANGNGMILAQEARQKFGAERILELMANDAWYREHTPRFREAFESRTILIPADIDVRDDLKQFQLIDGVGKIPSDVRKEGSDEKKRHADSAIALLNFHAATFMDSGKIEFQSLGSARVGNRIGDFFGGVGGGRGGFGDFMG